MGLFSSTQPSLRARVLTRFPAQVLAGNGISIVKSGGKYTFSVSLLPNQQARQLAAQFDSPIVGSQRDMETSFSCTIQRVALLANTVGNVVVDIYKVPFVSFPGTPANTICGGSKPTLSAAASFQDSALVGWNKNITAGDCLRFNIDSIATITRLAVILDVLVS